MKPFVHSQCSAKKYGGKPEDYLNIHNWFDQTKSHVPDLRHRAILHNSFGIFLCEQVFGTSITNSDGKLVSVRDIGEDHVSEDFHGFIPTVQDFLSNIEFKPWMNNGDGRPDSCKVLTQAEKPITYDGMAAMRKIPQELALDPNALDNFSPSGVPPNIMNLYGDGLSLKGGINLNYIPRTD